MEKSKRRSGHLETRERAVDVMQIRVGRYLERGAFGVRGQRVDNAITMLFAVHTVRYSAELAAQLPPKSWWIRSRVFHRVPQSALLPVQSSSLSAFYPVSSRHMYGLHKHPCRPRRKLYILRANLAAAENPTVFAGA